MKGLRERWIIIWSLLGVCRGVLGGLYGLYGKKIEYLLELAYKHLL